MKLNNYINETLKNSNFEYILGIPGVQNIMFYDDEKSGLKQYLVTNEQSAGFIGSGYYQSSDKLACLNLLGGPGITHSLPGIVNAYLSNIPLLIIVTTIKNNINYKFQIHDVNNYDILKNCTSDNIYLDNPSNIKEKLFQALETINETSKPVALYIPSNYISINLSDNINPFRYNFTKLVNNNILYKRFLKPDDNSELEINIYDKLKKVKEINYDIIVSDSKYLLNKVCNKLSDTKLLVPYICKTNGYAISTSLGVVLSNKYKNVLVLTTTESLITSGLEMISLEQFNIKSNLILCVFNNLNINLNEYAKSINFQFSNDIKNIKEGNYIIDFPINKFTIEKVNLIPETNNSIIRKCFLKHNITNIFTNEISINNKYFNNFMNIFTEEFKLVKFISNQATSFANDGYSRIRNNDYSCMITSNINECPYFISGLGESFMDNVRNFIIIIEKDKVTDIDSICKALSKKFIVINENSLKNSSFEDMFNNAIFNLKNGIPKPVILKIDYNILKTEFNQNSKNNFKLCEENYLLEYSLKNSIVNNINNCKNMMLYVGNGCVNCHNEIIEFVKKTNCLVSTTFSGKGLFSEKNKNWFWCGISSGIPEKLNKILDEIDLLLIVGAKMGELSTGHYRTRTFKQVYYIDIDEDNFNSNYDALNLRCDAKEFFVDINKSELEFKNNLIDSNIKIHNQINNYELSYRSDKVTAFKLTNTIQNIFPNNTIYSCDSGNSTLVAIESLRLTNPKCFIGPIDYSSMGYGVPSIIGASCDNRHSVLFEGDGAFLMTGLEIFIAKNLNKKIMVVILRDNELGMMSSIQRSINKKTNCTILPDYNLKELCESFGIKYFKISNENDLDRIKEIYEIVNKNNLVLVECIIDYNKKFYFTEGISKNKQINSTTLNRNNNIINCNVSNRITIKNDNFNLFNNILNKNESLFGSKIAIIDPFYKKEIDYINLKNLCIKNASFIQNNCEDKLIGVLLFNSYHVNILHFSIAITNKTLLNLNTSLKSNELEYILKDTKLKYLFTSIEFKDILEKILEKSFLEKIIWIDSNEIICKKILFYNFEEIINSNDMTYNKVTIMKNNNEDYFQMYYTSGTTGKPKGVLLTYDNVIKHMLGIIIEMRINELDKWLHVSPMFHLVDAFSIYSIPYVSGTQIIQNNYNIEETIQFLSNYKITITNIASTVGKIIIQNSLIQKYKYNLRILSCGGSPLDDITVKKIKEIFNCEFFVSYGMTECCGKISMSIVNKSNNNNYNYICSSGRPFGMTEVMIVDNSEKEIKENNIVGEILIRGSCLFKNYYNIENQDTFNSKGWFKTGDLGKWYNGYLKVVDRKKDMILVGSENVYCVEVEEVLNSYNGIKLSSVIGKKHNLLGEIPIAYLILEEKFNIDIKDLDEYCKLKLSNYKIPNKFIIVETLPMTGSGKINKKQLKESSSKDNIMQFNGLSELTKLTYKDCDNIIQANNNFNIMKNNDKFKNTDIIYYSDSNEIKNFFNFLQDLIRNNFNNKLIVIVKDNQIGEALIGLFRVFKNEYNSKSVIVKTNSDILESLDCIKNLINFNNTDYEYIYDGKLKSLDLKKFSEFSNNSYKLETQDKNEYILVTGGTGGIGKLFTKWLINNNFNNIFVLTRNEYKNTDKVNYIQVDVNSYESIENNILKINQQFKKCKYFFHLAGSLDNSLINDLTWSKFENVIEPKINYLNNILKVFDDNNYQICKTILFSSVYSILGYSKLSHYSCANAYLNGISKTRENTISICWGTWDEDGMAYRLGNNFKKYWKSQGMDYVVPDNCFNLIFYLIDKEYNGTINYFPINTDIFYQQKNCIPSFYNFKEILPLENNMNNMKNIIEKYVEIKSETLGLTLNELGIDSLSTIQLQNELNENNILIDNIFNIQLKNILQYNEISERNNKSNLKLKTILEKYIDINNETLSFTLNELGVDSLTTIQIQNELNQNNFIIENLFDKKLQEIINKNDSTQKDNNNVSNTNDNSDINVHLNRINNIIIGTNTNVICEKIGNNINIGNNCTVEIKEIPNNFEMGDNSKLIIKY